jgi:hypothetical protein
LILRDGRWPFACHVVFATAGAGGPGPALGCNVQAQQNIGSVLLFFNVVIVIYGHVVISANVRAETKLEKRRTYIWWPKKHVPLEFAPVSKLFPNFFQRLFPNFSKLFGKKFFGKKFGKKWFSPVEPFVDHLIPWDNCHTGAWTKVLVITDTRVRIE